MNTCNTCEWFVEETDVIGDYQHLEAKRWGFGFCLVKDLFTPAEANDKCCQNYVEENRCENKERN